MRHHDGYICLFQGVPCRAAQDGFAQSAVAIGTHHDHVCTHVFDVALQHIRDFRHGFRYNRDFDTRPNDPEMQGPVNSISTSVTGLKISEYLPKTARQMHRIALIKSMTSTQGAHQQANYFMHTSYAKRGTIAHPGLGSWIMRLDGARNSTLPGNVLINGGSNAVGSGWMESKYGPLPIGDAEKGLQHSERHDSVTESRYYRRLDFAQTMNQGFGSHYDHRKVRAYNDMYDAALRLMNSRDLAAFDITDEPDKLRDAYGRNKFGQGCLLARRLVENQVRFVEVQLGGWDTHADNFDRVPANCDTLDSGLATLLADLDARGMLDETLVVLATEFGRTPRIDTIRNGRDHYPKAFSCLLAGGGVGGGQVYGESEPDGSDVKLHPVSIPEFNATIAYSLGLPLDHIVMSANGRPFQVAHKGRPITKLFT